MKELDTIIFPFQTHIHIKVIDKDGNVLDEKVGHNAETLWAKTHTPTDIWLDFIIQPLEEILHRPVNQINKTAFNKANDFRSRLLNDQFSRNGNVYDNAFNWTNNGDSPVILHGLISYNNDNVYTLFDFDNDTIKVPPSSMVTGRYQIIYDNETPSVSDDGVSTDTVNSNSIQMGFYESISPAVRKYKYSRVFYKTSEYRGVDTNDTGVTSSVSVDIDSSDAKKVAWGNTSSGELFYKFLSSGNPGAATARRYNKYYRIYNTYYNEWYLRQVVSSNVTYTIDDFYRAKWSNYHYYRFIDYVSTTVIRTKNDVPIDIYPWKIQFPNNIDTFSGDNWWYDTPSYLNFFLYIIPNIRYLDDSTSYAQFIAYLYWGDSPKFNFLLRSNTSSFTCTLYINGTKYTPSSVDNYGNRSYRVNFDLSSLLAGEGIIILTLTNVDSILKVFDSNRYFKNMTPSFLFETDMYGYAIPYAGMMTNGIGNITSNWINATCFNYDGTDIVYDDMIADETDASKVSLINNSRIPDLINTNDYQYWVWVKLSEKDTKAGEVYIGNRGRLLSVFTSTNIYNQSYSDTCISSSPLYLTEDNVPHFIHCVDSYNNLSPHYSRSYNPVTMIGVLEDMFQLTDCNYFSIDKTNREINWISDKALNFPYDKDVISYIARRQGEQEYNYRFPEWIADYTEGTPTISHNGNLYEIETTINSSEKIQYLTLSFDSSSVFATNEYLGFIVLDNDNYIFTDALETWHLDKVDSILYSTIDPTKKLSSVGVDDYIDEFNNSNAKVLDQVGDIVSTNVVIPDTTTAIANKDFTNVSIYQISISDTWQETPILYIPKVIDKGQSTEKFVDISTLYVTDGIHAIPWNLDSAGVTRKDYLFEVEDHFSFWTVRLNRDVFLQINPDWKQSVFTVYAYFTAKAKADLLPLDVDIFYQAHPPIGRNDENSYIYLRWEDDEIKNKANSDFAVSDIGQPTEITNVTRENDWIVFDSSLSARIIFSHNFHSYADWSDFTIDFFINVPNFGEEMYIMSHMSHTSNNDGIKLYINTLGYLCVWMYGETLVQVKLNENTDHYISVVRYKGRLKVYVDGNLAGSANETKDDHGYFLDPLYIGCSKDEDSYFNGKLKNFHYSSVARWLGEHYPLVEGWDNVKDFLEPVPCGWRTVRIVLPFTVDNKIKVVKKDDGSTLPFTQLTEFNFPNDYNDGYGNILYVMIPFNIWNKKTYHSIYPYLQSIESLNTLSYSNNAQNNKDTVDISGIHFVDAPNYASIGFTASKELLDATFDKFYSSVISVYDWTKVTVTIDSSNTEDGTHPNSFFDLYIYPDNFGNYTKTWGLPSYTKSKYKISMDASSSGYGFDLGNSTIVDVYQFNSESNVYVFTACGDEDNLSSIGGAIQTGWKNPSFSSYIRQPYTPVTAGITYNGSIHYGDRIGSSNGDTLVLKDIINLHTLCGYHAPEFYWNKYKTLSLSVVTSHDGNELDYYTYYYPIDIMDLEMGSATEILYTTNRLLSDKDIAGHIIDDKRISSNLPRCYSFYLDTNELEFLDMPYINKVGCFPLSVQSKSMYYNLYLTDQNKEAKHETNYYLVRDIELTNLLNIGAIGFPYTQWGYINSTNLNTVPSTTQFVSNPTDTIVIKKWAVTPTFIDAPYGNGTLMTIYSDNKDVAELFFKERENLFESIEISAINPTYNWFDFSGKRGDYDVPGEILHTLKTPVFNRNCFDGFFTDFLQRDSIFSKYNQHYYDAMGIQNEEVQTSGEIGEEAVRVDCFILPRVNTNLNIAFASQRIPMDDVIRFGNFSYHGGSNCNLKVYPLIKVFNSNTSEEKVFALDQYYVPWEITELVTDISTLEDKFTAIEMYSRNNFLSFEPFNSLLNNFVGNEYSFQYGFLFYSTKNDNHFVLRGITIQPLFADKNIYKTINYGFYNEKLDLLTDNSSDLSVDTTSYEVKIKNPNSQAVSNYAFRLDLSEYDLSGFINGIIIQTPALADLPTVYETGDNEEVTTDFTKWNGRYVWFKINTIPSGDVGVFYIVDKTNNFTTTDVFDFYEDFEVLDTSKWNVSYTEPTYSVSGNDVDNGTGNTSLSDRMIEIKHYLPLDVKDSKLYFSNSETISLSSTSNISNDLVVEFGYQSRNTCFGKYIYAGSFVSPTEEIVPYWFQIMKGDYDPDGIGDGGDVDNGTGATSTSERGCLTGRIINSFMWVKMDIVAGENVLNIYHHSTNGKLHDYGDPSDVFDISRDFRNSDCSGWDVSFDGQVNYYTNQYRSTTYGSPDFNLYVYSNYKFRNCMTLYSSYSSSYNMRTWGDVSFYGVDKSCIDFRVYNWNYPWNDDCRLKFYDGFRDIYRDVNASGNEECHYFNNNWRFLQIDVKKMTRDRFTWGLESGRDIVSHFNCGNFWGEEIGDKTNLFTYRENWQARWESIDSYGYQYCNGIFANAIPESIGIKYDRTITEDGSWTIGGFTYSKRTRVYIHSEKTESDIVLKIKTSKLGISTDMVVTEYKTYKYQDDLSSFISIDICGGSGNVPLKIESSQFTETEVPANIVAKDGTEDYHMKFDSVEYKNNIYLYWNTSDGSNKTFSREVNRRIYSISDNFEGDWFDNTVWHVLNPNNMEVSNGKLQYTSRTKIISTLRNWNMLHKFYSYSESGRSAYESVNLMCFFTLANNAYGVVTTDDVGGYGRVIAWFWDYQTTSSIYIGDYDMSLRNDMFSTYSGISCVLKCKDEENISKRAIRNCYSMIGGRKWPDRFDSRDQKRYYHYFTYYKRNLYDKFIDKTVENGSWTINGETYLNRRKITIVNPHEYKDALYWLPGFIGDDTGYFNTTIVHNNKYKLIYQVDTVSTPVKASVRFKDSNVSYKFQPLRNSKWFTNEYSEKSIDMNCISTGKIGFIINAGGKENGFEIDWIRVRQYSELDLIQYKNSDIKIVIEKKPTDWYLFDLTTSYTPNITDIQSLFTVISERNRSGWDFRKLDKFQDVSDYNSGIPGEGSRFLVYKLE